MMPYPEWLPEVNDLAAMMRARTRGGEFGASDTGVFDETTRPTAEQAQKAIEDAADIVIAKVGSNPQGAAENIARMAVKLRAAMIIELGYFPEQAGTQQSPYSSYREEYADVIKDAIEAAIETEDGEEVAAGGDETPVGEFPDDNGFLEVVW